MKNIREADRAGTGSCPRRKNPNPYLLIIDIDPESL